jgi:SAM-dependent methyltransferase
MDASAYARMFAIEESLWWYRGRRRVCFGLLERHLGERTDLEILDVGCGTGYNLPLLGRFGRVQGVDMSPEALEFCRRRGVGSVTLHQAGELPFADASFDLLTAFDVIEHIEADRSALLEFNRTLRPGGWMLIYTPALPWLYNEHDRIVHHQRRYRRVELETKIQEAGFRLVHTAYVNGLVLPLVLLARGLAKLRRSAAHQEMEVPSAPINALVTALCYAEEVLVRRDLLPVGMTLVALARKAGREQSQESHG